MSPPGQFGGGCGCIRRRCFLGETSGRPNNPLCGFCHSLDYFDARFFRGCDRAGPISSLVFVAEVFPAGGAVLTHLITKKALPCSRLSHRVRGTQRELWTSAVAKLRKVRRRVVENRGRSPRLCSRHRRQYSRKRFSHRRQGSDNHSGVEPHRSA